MLTPHDSQCHVDLSGIRTCDHPHASPALCHYMGTYDSFNQTPLHFGLKLLPYYISIPSILSIAKVTEFPGGTLADADRRSRGDVISAAAMVILL